VRTYEGKPSLNKSQLLMLPQKSFAKITNSIVSRGPAVLSFGSKEKASAYFCGRHGSASNCLSCRGIAPPQIYLAQKTAAAQKQYTGEYQKVSKRRTISKQSQGHLKKMNPATNEAAFSKPENQNRFKDFFNQFLRARHHQCHNVN